jgi:hypothetical protein
VHISIILYIKIVIKLKIRIQAMTVAQPDGTGDNDYKQDFEYSQAPCGRAQKAGGWNVPENTGQELLPGVGIFLARLVLLPLIQLDLRGSVGFWILFFLFCCHFLDPDKLPGNLIDLMNHLLK